MAIVSVDLPADSYEQLQRRAQAAGKSPEALSRELLEAALVETGAPQTTRAEPCAPAWPAGHPDGELPSVRDVLRAAGHLAELDEDMRSLIIPGVTLEEVHEIFRTTDGPSLTDIILEQRGPKG
jgi:hypothetical protein